MNLSDFRIGSEFWCSDRRWRCTDIGTRVAVAILVGEATITRSDTATGECSTRTIDGAEAEKEGWFNGPPYGVAESVFDEYDMEGCSLDREDVHGSTS